MTEPLLDQVAFITGGGSGIGLAVAKGLLQAGARVAIAGRTRDRLIEAEQLLQGGDRVRIYAIDVTRPESVAAAVQSLIQAWGRIDLLVNNAGLNIKDRRFRQLTPESWNTLVRNNLDGAFYCTQAVLPGMIEQGGGMIINISSVAGLRANPLGGAAYAAAKFGVHAMGTCLAAEEKDSGIRVTTIFPGEVDTPILVNRPEPVTEEHRARILKPEDVAAAVLFVANLPARVSVPELIIKPSSQAFI